jgi:hypothetical protein
LTTGLTARRCSCSVLARDFIMAELVTKQDLALALETQTLRLTVRVGAMLVVGLGALATILKLTYSASRSN